VDRARSALDGHMRAEVEVKLEGVRTARLDQRTRQGVVVAVALASFRKEADVVALAGDDLVCNVSVCLACIGTRVY
jgi:hypothetical protein